MIAGAFVGGFAPNIGTLMGSRVLLGIGTAFARELTVISRVPKADEKKLLPVPLFQNWRILVCATTQVVS